MGFDSGRTGPWDPIEVELMAPGGESPKIAMLLVVLLVGISRGNVE